MTLAPVLSVIGVYLLATHLGHAQESEYDGVSVISLNSVIHFFSVVCLIKRFGVILLLQTCRPESKVSLDNQTTIRWFARPSQVVSDKYPHVYESQPVCLDQHKIRITRECNDARWTPQLTPVCNHVQEPYDEHQTCIPGYQKAPQHINDDLCINILSPDVWNTICPAGYTTLFYDLDTDSKEYVLELLRKRNLTSIWMPAKRIHPNGPVLWSMPGDRNGENIVDLISDFEAHERVYKSDCFVAHVKTKFMTIDLDDCDVKYPILCLYDEKYALSQLACPDGFYTTSYKDQHHMCYSGHKTLTTSSTLGTKRPAATTTSPTTYVNTTIGYSEKSRKLTRDDSDHGNYFNIECQGEVYTITSSKYTTIARWLAKELRFGKQEHCLFAISSNGMYVRGKDEWMNVVSQVQYMNWDYPVEYGDYLTVNMDGRWNWVPRSFNCLLCQRNIDLETPKMYLNFDEQRTKLFLTTYDEQFLWRLRGRKFGITCFTNADYELVRTVNLNRVWTYEISKGDDFSNDTMNEQRVLHKTIYELSLHGDGPGYYWCHGYSIPNFDLVEAPRIVATRRDRGTVFVGRVKVQCYGKTCVMVFDDDYVKELARSYRNHLRKYQRENHINVSVDNVRLMKIEEINPVVDKAKAMGKATVLFHITVRRTGSPPSNNQSILPENLYAIWELRKLLRQIMQKSNTTEYEFLWLRSTEYCLPEELHSNKRQTWSAAKIGETIAPQELCLGHNGLPVLRSCVGDFLNGGEWINITQQECKSAVSDITQKLYEMDNNFTQSDKTFDVVEKINNLLTDSAINSMVPADLFYLGRVMSTVDRVASDTNVSTINSTESESIFSIYNSIMSLNENTTRIAAALNSTNILLSAFDNIINGISMNIASATQVRNNVIVNAADGTVSAKTSKLIMYIIDPLVRNVSGIALRRKSDNVNPEHSDFNAYMVELLYTNQSTTDFETQAYQDNLELATFVPQELLERLNETRFPRTDEAPAVRIVITFFYNDVLFQEYKNVTYAKSSGRVISVSIPGYGPNLPAHLPILMRHTNHSSSACGYWSFGSQSGWQKDGCEYGGHTGSIVLCTCSHLTHFSYLLTGTLEHTLTDGDEYIVLDMSHQIALDFITLLGCSLSLVGILGIFTTAILFKSWREKHSSIVLLQLSAAVGLQMTLLLFVNTEYSAMYLVSEERRLLCIGMGALLQYSILVAFSWMLITAYLQFMRYVKVLGEMRPSRFFLKSFLIGWGVPLIPVLLVVGLAPSSYVKHIELQSEGICYPSGNALYFGIILPIGLIILANLIIFLMVIFNILFGPGGKLRATDRDLTLAQLRLSVLLFFLLGLSWIFGLLASTKAGLVFSYLFCLTATIQGFVLFVYFIVLDPGTRRLWRNFFSKYVCCCFRDKIIDCK